MTESFTSHPTHVFKNSSGFWGALLEAPLMPLPPKLLAVMFID